MEATQPSTFTTQELGVVAFISTPPFHIISKKLELNTVKILILFKLYLVPITSENTFRINWNKKTVYTQLDFFSQ